MKKKDLMQIKGLTLNQLVIKAKGLKKEIADLVMDKNMKKVKDIKIISKKRKELAKVLTITRQKVTLSELEAK